MSDLTADSVPTLSPEELERVDRACDEFEEAWKRGERPELKAFAKDLDTPVGKVLLRELLKVELAYRVERGERPTAEEYTAIFPEHDKLIAAVFAEAADKVGRGEQPTTPPSSSAIDPGSLAPSEPPAVLESIGRYKVIRRLGGGTYGDVYLAHDGVMDRQVAVKVPSARLLATDRAREEFLREARSVARLQHEGIVRAHDFGEAEGHCYIVFEFIDGESLADRIKPERLATQPLPPEEAARIVAAVAEALHYAHLQEMFHRDVKPANILLDRQGRPKLTDFGQAVREADLAGQRGLLVGTLLYMSPEQVRREGHHSDGRIDIYSLGVVLYELLCGRRPFEATEVDELIDQIKHREAKPPRQVKDSIPRELERVCLKALSKNIKDRFTTAKDVAEELRRIAPRDSGSAIPSDAHCFRLVVGDRCVQIRLNEYGPLSDLLDNIYLAHLSSTIPAFTYGSEWILMSERAGILAVPFEWVIRPGQSIRTLKPEWKALVWPEKVGVQPSTDWRIITKHEIEDYRKKGFITVGTNDPGVGHLLHFVVKGLWQMIGDGILRECAIDHAYGTRFRYLYVLPKRWNKDGPLITAYETSDKPVDEWLREEAFSRFRMNMWKKT
ncbi:MAG TPA: serine/threonine-protein kinase [Gemmataceae bacterium]|nr:serine/threonine-protein kinase [Gemmataceae bacterium]